MKRKAAEEQSLTATKKQALPSNPSGDPGNTSYKNNYDTPAYSHDGSESGLYTGTAAAATMPATPASTVAASTTKFPCDFKTIECTVNGCSKTFNRPARLEAHLRSHFGDRPYKCSQCDKTYVEEKHLRQHVKATHEDERPYACQHPGCGAAFLTNTRLRRHAAVHETADRFRCSEYDDCDKTFRKQATLDRHVRSVHLGEKAFICGNDDCKLGFDKAKALRRHVERSHPNVMFWCSECQGEDGAGVEHEDGNEYAERPGFTSLALLDAHMRDTHTHAVCVFCDITTESRLALELHVELHHSGMTDSQKAQKKKKTADEVHGCEWEGCAKTFSRKANLNVHIRTAHWGLRFVCGEFDLTTTEDLTDWDGQEACGKQFVARSKLEEHVRHIHLQVERTKPSKNPKERTQPGMVGMLAGVVEATVRCMNPGCGEVFLRHHDLEVHVANAHSFIGYHEFMPAAQVPDAGIAHFEGDPYEQQPYDNGMGQMDRNLYWTDGPVHDEAQGRWSGQYEDDPAQLHGYGLQALQPLAEYEQDGGLTTLPPLAEYEQGGGLTTLPPLAEYEYDDALDTLQPPAGYDQEDEEYPPRDEIQDIFDY